MLNFPRLDLSYLEMWAHHPHYNHLWRNIFGPIVAYPVDFVYKKVGKMACSINTTFVYHIFTLSFYYYHHFALHRKSVNLHEIVYKNRHHSIILRKHIQNVTWNDARGICKNHGDSVPLTYFSKTELQNITDIVFHNLIMQKPVIMFTGYVRKIPVSCSHQFNLVS